MTAKLTNFEGYFQDSSGPVKSSRSSRLQAFCKIKDLTVNAGIKQLLTVPELTLFHHQMTTFIGPNGAGKSTLLHSLLNQNMGSRLKTSGTIHINLEQNTIATPLITAGKIAWVGQHEQFQLPLTVLEYALLGVSPQLAWYQTANANQVAKAKQLLHNFELTHLQQRRVQNLSGGEKQRLAVVRALMQDTQVLMLDEPTNHLDIRHQRFLLSYLRQLVHEHNKTILIVLHDLTHAYKYSDQVLLMHEGQVIAKGSPQEIMTQDKLSKVYQTDIETYDTKSGRLFVS